jgi:hypothetical protein
VFDTRGHFTDGHVPVLNVEKKFSSFFMPKAFDLSDLSDQVIHFSLPYSKFIFNTLSMVDSVHDNLLVLLGLSNKNAEGTAEIIYRQKRRIYTAVQDKTALSAGEKLEADYN